ncbi:SKP1 component [Corchorus capsularis]|uniref:SKP1-like protein n=1 Tax=Corchorus capsularis TaxID=210143 RepID=A0A1R3H7Z8_COCAP|nr:SKP1 component [Corchorus capsularis]
MSTAKKVTLVTADKVEFEVDEAVAMRFGIVKSFLEENPEKIPLPNVNSSVLSLIIDYCKAHVEFASSENKADEKAKEFDENFVKAQGNETLVAMCMAVNYLEEKELLNMVLDAIANKIKNKSVEFVRKYFGIKNDFPPEEEEALRRENHWAFQDVDVDDNE